jgi:acetyl esterase/lipase
MRTLLTYIYRGLRSQLAGLGMLILNTFPPSVDRVVSDVRYGQESSQQALDVIIPNGDPPFPVLVYIHGGGFYGKDKKEYSYMVRSFAHRSFVVFNINYRLAPRYTFPCVFQDVSRAIRWVHDNAGRYGGDVQRIFLAGDSTGAYLASMYAEAIQSQELMSSLSMQEGIPPGHLKGLLLFYGFYDLETVMQTDFPTATEVCAGYFGSDPQVFPERARIASPARHVPGSFPPALLISGEKDGLHPESVAFDRVLTEKEVPHQALFFSRERYPLALHSHGFATFPFLRCARIALKGSYEFLEEMS